ncbi:MAG TPA: glycine cleavage T C-terminal barrel domain-containing protein [Polyangiales bacterium]|nr:glycine cleavage T C-terminal barrel domain-containing protein [Polyangiales bacterium]
MVDVDKAQSEQANAVAARAGFWIRADLGVLRVQGDDRLTWLNGQLTNDLRKLESESSVRALAVHVRGKIMAEVWVVSAAEELLVVLPRTAEATLLESFERYIIMEDVTLAPWPTAQVVQLLGPLSGVSAPASAGGALPEGGFAFDELGFGGRAWLGEPEALAPVLAALRGAGVPEIDERGYELARLRAGSPRYGRDFGDRSYPQEAGLKALVSFAKGCYLGQEVVCTLENRGRLNRQLALFTGRGAPPAPSSQLVGANSEALGEVTSAVFDADSQNVLALGYVKRAHAAPGTTLTAAGTQLTLQRLVGAEGA